jgi:hypothetical protein
MHATMSVVLVSVSTTPYIDTMYFMFQPFGHHQVMYIHYEFCFPRTLSNVCI